jgi:hypothetical protein
MQVPDVGHHSHHSLAVNFEQYTEHSVRRRVLRPHVQDHGAILAGL